MTINNKSSSTNDVEMPDGSNNDRSSYNRVGGGGGNSSEESILQKTLSHMERMEKVMTSVEGKLADMSSLERRCEELEAKCSSLENTLMNHIDKKIDSLHVKCSSTEDRIADQVRWLDAKVERSLKYLEKNDIVVSNHNYVYPIDVSSYYEVGDVDEATYLQNTAIDLKEMTIKMRRGKFDYDDGETKGFVLYTHQDDEQFRSCDLQPHLKEFAAALEQFTPVMKLLPDRCESFFNIVRFHLNDDAVRLIKEALIGKPFNKMRFVQNSYHPNHGLRDYEGFNVDAILEIAQSNTHLRKLEISHNHIDHHHVGRLCAVVLNHRSLVELDLRNSTHFTGIGDRILNRLVTNNRDFNIQGLGMASNSIKDSIPLLADFLATNPRLKYIDLSRNRLTDVEATLIANALRSNTILRHLYLCDNDGITSRGVDSFRSVLCDDSSLNAIAASNHVCLLDLDTDCSNVNCSEVPMENRRWKIYSLLEKRYFDETTSNVEHFCHVDVRILPHMLEVIQKCSEIFYNDDIDDDRDEDTDEDVSENLDEVDEALRHLLNEDVGEDMVGEDEVFNIDLLGEDEDESRGGSDPIVRSLSIVYEIMRNLDQVFSLYEAVGAGSNKR